MNKIRIRTFGAFRKYFPDGVMTFSIKENESVGEFKARLNQFLIEEVAGFSDAHLVFESAIASGDTILQDTDVIKLDKELSLLPPVCGG